jgi:AcrR family transcriptional regulator
MYVLLECFTYDVLVKGVSMRAKFTADQIAATALRIVDESGVAALSMRTLAAALGTGPMTLYNYVSDKEGLEE